jgi:hypothetical protein
LFSYLSNVRFENVFYCDYQIYTYIEILFIFFMKAPYFIYT